MDWNLDEAIHYYENQGAPRDQNALVSLFRELQTECGGSIPQYTLSEIAAAYGIGESFLKAVIKRIPSLRMQNTHLLEICSGQNCSKHSHIAEYAEIILNSNPEKFQIKYIPCMRMCRYGPSIKLDNKLYNNIDIPSLKELLDNL